MAKKSQSGDLQALGKRVSRLVKGVEVATIKVQKNYTLEILESLVKNTPVDVGTARSNWRVSAGRPLTGKISAHMPYPSRHRPPYGAGGSMSESANANKTIEVAKNRLLNFKSGSIYISNNLPYINRLDGGYSDQSSGFIDRAILQGAKSAETGISAIFEEELSK